ncbi:hypothetical protein CBOM_07081 [Ceraceosorus bombacis]|uniref:Uncharacterized protein n=1 Tax=Ceraceosorus bombacis TaxID=401625 RepID=A0A0P1A3E7_9BASI|nr:hypothetical protein CBOM_07081 [Ceraceosorus bombacis]
MVDTDSRPNPFEGMLALPLTVRSKFVVEMCEILKGSNLPLICENKAFTPQAGRA